MPPARRTPAGSARPGPADGGALDTEQVLAAALHIVDTEGLPALSMRRLGRALDREAMTLYRYAASKTSLLDGVTDLVLRGLDVDPRAADWRQELRKLADDFRALALAHPNVVPLLLTRPLATPPGRRLPGTLRPLEDFLELFTGAGFTPPTRCTPTGCSSASCTATSCTNSKNSSTTPTKPTTCCASAYTGCRWHSSPGCAPSPANSPATTAPPSSTKEST